MLIIPAIDLRDGKCVRLTQGRRQEVKVYDGDPVLIARKFENAGARMLHVVDLDGAFADRNSKNRKVVRRIIRAVEIPVQFGGGLRSVADAGVDRIVYTDVARDGMLSGVNLEQTCSIARESGLRVTASGGVSSLKDLRQLKTISRCGVDSVIVGKALYEGRFTLQEALK